MRLKETFKHLNIDVISLIGVHEKEIKVLVKHRFHLHHHPDHVLVHGKNLVVGKDVFECTVRTKPRSKCEVELSFVSSVFDISEFAIWSSIEVTNWNQIVIPSIEGILRLGILEKSIIVYLGNLDSLQGNLFIRDTRIVIRLQEFHVLLVALIRFVQARSPLRLSILDFVKPVLYCKYLVRMLNSFETRNQIFCQTNLLHYLFAFICGEVDLHVPNLNPLDILSVVETDIVVDNIISITVHENVRSPKKVNRVVRREAAPVC